MSAALITLFAVSIVGALGMAVYALRVLLGRWDRPQRFRPKPPPMMPAQPPQQARPVPPAQYLAPPVPRPMAPMAMGQQHLVPSGLPSLPASMPRSSMPPASPVWVAPAGSAPAPYVPPFAIATPLPINVGSPGAPPVPGAGLGAWTPPLRAPTPRAPTPKQVSGLVPPDAPRLARGSIPPDYAPDHDGLLEEPDTDPGVPAMVQDEPVVTRGARYSVIRSSRR